MGNEASGLLGQGLPDIGPPKMALRIEALVIPPPEAEPLLVWNQGEDEFHRQVTPKAAILSDDCFVTVRLDNEELDGGRMVSEFPCRPIQIEAKSWGAMLEIQFFASGLGEKPWSALCAPISKMLRFGAPLYTSLWLGLDTLDRDHLSETASYSGSTADVSLKGALARAHVHDSPKVRITLFSATIEKGGSTRQAQSSFDVAGACDVTRINQQHPEKVAQQVDGLIRCLDESNDLLHTLYKSAALATFREHLKKTMREMRAAYKLAEETFFVDSERLHAEVEQLRRQHADIIRGQDSAINQQKHLNAAALMAKHVESESQRQQVDARVEEHHKHLQRNYEERAAGPDLSDELEDSHSVLQAELRQTLTQSTATWRSRVNDVIEEQDQQLQSHRDASQVALAEKNLEIERLTSEHNALQGELAKLLVEHADRTKCNQAEREKMSIRLTEAMAAAEREFDEHQSKVESAERDHLAEVNSLRATLDAHQRELAKEIAQAHIRQSDEQTRLVAKHQAERDRDASEALQKHEREIQALQVKKEEEMRVHDSIQQTQRQQMEELKRDLREKEHVTRERLAEAAKWQAEVHKLHSQLHELYTHGQRQEEERQQLVDDRQAQLNAMRQGVLLMQLQGAQSAAEKQRMHAEELQRMVEAHTSTLGDYQHKRDALRAQMRSMDEEATKRCDGVPEEFKLKLAEIAEAFQASHKTQNEVEERSLEALAAKDAEFAKKLADVDAARVSETAALQEAIESHITASGKEHAQMNARLGSIKAEAAAVEAKLLEDARKKLEEHRGSLQAAHSKQAEIFSEELRRFHQQRLTSQVEAQRKFEFQKQDLEIEAKSLREEVKDLPSLLAKNSCKFLELQRIRKSHANESVLRSNAAPVLVSVTAALEKCHLELSAMRHKLDRAEERWRNSAQEVMDVKEAQAAELAALEAEVVATVNAADAERTSLQGVLQIEKGTAAKFRLQSLEDLEGRYKPELDNLRQRLECYRIELQEHQHSSTRAIAELQSTAGADLKFALISKTRALNELTRTRDDIATVRAGMEAASVRRKLDAEEVRKASEEQATLRLKQHDQSVAEELGTQGERQSQELSRLNQMHEEDRRRLQTIAQNNEIELRQLQSHMGTLEKEVSDKLDGISNLKSEWAACIDNRDKELLAHTEKHESALAEERAKIAEHHDFLQKEAADQHKDLGRQVCEARSECSRLDAEIKALRASMEQEGLEIHRDSEATAKTITDLRAKVQAVEEELQSERQKGRRKSFNMQQDLSQLENLEERFAFTVGESQRQLQIAVADTQKQLDFAVRRHSQARADLELIAQDHELKRQRELHNRQVSFEHDISQRALEHKAHMEALSLNYKVAMDEDIQAHESALQPHLSKLALLKSQMAELEPAPQAAESLNRQILEVRENISELTRSLTNEALTYSRERQQMREELVKSHIEELEQDRLRHEEGLREHDLELERSRGQLQRQIHEAHEEHPDLMHCSDLDSLHRQLELQLQVLQDGSAHPQASELYQSVERDFAESLSENLEAVHQKATDHRRKSLEIAHQEAKTRRRRASISRENQLSEAQAELLAMTERFQVQLQDNEAAHRLRLEAVKQKASQDAVLAAEVQADLKRQLAAAEDVARKLEADAERMRQAHQLDMKLAGEREQACIEEVKFRESEADREFTLEAEEIRQSGEARIQEIRDQRLRHVEQVRREAVAETERRMESLRVIIKRDVWFARQMVSDLQKRHDRVQGQSDVRRGIDKRLQGDERERRSSQVRRSSSLLGPVGRRTSEPLVHWANDSNSDLVHWGSLGAVDSRADPLDDSLNRMILQLFRRLLAERYAVVVKDEVDKSFDKLLPDVAGHIRISPADLALEVAHILKSKRQCSVKEAFSRLDPERTGKVLDSELDSCFHNAYALDAETRGHITFLIEYAVKLLRTVQNGEVRSGEGYMSDEEFRKVLEDTRL